MYRLLAVCVLAAAASSTGHAQTTIRTDEFSADSFFPAPGDGNYFMVDGARVSGNPGGSVHLWFDHAHRPFVLDTQCMFRTEIDCDAEIDGERLGERQDVVQRMMTVELVGAMTFLDLIQVGIGIPFVYAQGEEFTFAQGSPPTPNLDVPGGSVAALGDIRLHLKIALPSLLDDLLHLAVVAQGFIPTGQITAENHYVGEDGFSGEAHTVFEITADRINAAINLGAIFRSAGSLVANDTRTQMTYAGALSYAVTPFFHTLAELQGATRFGAPDEKLETRLGLRFQWNRFRFDAGGGFAIVRGIGAPRWRLFAAVGYATTSERDSDEDGVLDSLDGCPDEAEDQDGFADEDGCPEADNDDDGFADGEDQCPDEAEDQDEFQDEDGCPDPDNDGDGVRDGYDSCPDAQEDIDGDRDEDGCPEEDRDRDGVNDEVDQCPDDPEDTDGFGDEDGCPETDADGDRIPDELDECPGEPEDRNRREDEDGCPDAT